MTSTHPPKAPLILNVGIIGHRPGDRLKPAEFERVEGEITHLLNHFKRSMKNIKKDHANIFNQDDPVINIITAMASGADQIGAKAALKKSMPFQAVLPFFREEYAADFITKNALIQYENLLAEAQVIIELPGIAEDKPLAYETAGHFIIDKSDILITIWDREKSGGRGGTTEMIEYASKRSIPVIHIHSNKNNKPDFISDLILTSDEYKNCHNLVSNAVLPSNDRKNLSALKQFYKETPKRFSLNIFYPLLQMLLIIRKPKLKDIYQQSYEFDQNLSSNKLKKLFDSDMNHKLKLFFRKAFAFADGLGVRYNQFYRDSYVINFGLAAFAVLLALFGGVIFPDNKIDFITAEIIIILLLLLNIQKSSNNQCHKRWLDYRHLSERLRLSMIWSLLGTGKHTLQDTDRSPDWVRWYTHSLRKAISIPNIQLNNQVLEIIQLELKKIVKHQALPITQIPCTQCLIV